jgi:hypothetical protein
VLLLSVAATFNIIEKENGKERGVGKNKKGKKKKIIWKGAFVVDMPSFSYVILFFFSHTSFTLWVHKPM